MVDPLANGPAPSEAAGSHATRELVTELVTLAVSLAIGVVVMPCLIFLVGEAKLGDYVRGGLFTFWRDFLLGLAHGSQAFWFVAIAPYLLVWLVRAGRRLWQT